MTLRLIYSVLYLTDIGLVNLDFSVSHLTKTQASCVIVQCLVELPVNPDLHQLAFCMISIYKQLLFQRP